MISPRNFALFAVLTAGAVGSWYLARPGGDADGDELPIDSAYTGYYLKSARILGTGDIFETYKRYSPIRKFPPPSVI